MKHVTYLAVAASLALLSPLPSFAQERPPGQPGQPGQPGGDRGRGSFDPEEYRKRMTERLKEALKATDEEWTVLQPLVEKVSEKNREVMSSRFGGFSGSSRGPGGPPGSGSSGGSPGSSGGSSSGSRYGGTPNPHSQALRETLEKEGASNEEIKARLAAVREHRKRAQSELETAREALKQVVTTRQEAVLVSMGMLE